MDFFDSIEALILFQQVYRLALFRVHKKQNKIITENFQYLWSFLFISAIVCEFGYCGYLLFNQETLLQEKRKIFSLIFYMEVSLTTVCTIYYSFNAIFKRKHQMNFFSKIQQIDYSLLNNFKISVDYKNFKVSSLISLVAVFLYYNVVVLGTFIFFQKSISKRNFTLNSSAVLVIYITQATSLGIFTHGYVSSVVLIYQRISKLATKLEEIKEQEKVRKFFNNL